jgi:hypothetical protein
MSPSPGNGGPRAPYPCHRTRSALPITGRLDEPAWRQAPKSPRFVDVVSGGPALYDTRAAALWDDANLYVGFWVEEPFVRADLTERDSIIFSENDVEVFIDGIDAYYELEINARNTVYEVFFIWKDAYEPGGRFDVPEFNLFARDAHSFGGNDYFATEYFWRGSHPRGLRWAIPDWDFPGLRTAVHVSGDINNPASVDQGWTVEVALPWAGMGPLAHGRPVPPSPGDVWQLQFARYEKILSTGQHVGWTWDPVGSHDNHRPEAFTRIRFEDQDVETMQCGADAH